MYRDDKGYDFNCPVLGKGLEIIRKDFSHNLLCSLCDVILNADGSK